MAKMQNSSNKFVIGVGILKGMGAVRIKEAAPIRAPLFDDLLRSHRTLRDGLRCNGVHNRLAAGIHDGFTVGAHPLHLLRLDQFHGVIGPQVLHHSLRNQEE